jgi:hypothetical protein
MFKDRLQNLLEEMEQRNPSPSLKNNPATNKEKLYFLQRRIFGDVKKVSDYQDFERAKWDETYRQDFIEGIDLESYKPYVTKVIYKGKIPRLEGINRIFGASTSVVMQTSLEKGLFQKKRSKISVFPVAFSSECSPTLGDFKSILIDHEGFHAKDLYLNWDKNSLALQSSSLFLLQELLISAFTSELDAYENQLQNGAEREISELSRIKLNQKKHVYQELISAIRKTIIENPPFTA